MTFEEFWPNYQKKKLLQTKKTTVAIYSMMWESHMREYFGPIDMDSVKNSTIQKYVDEQLLRGVLSVHTIQDHMTVVKNMLKLWNLEQDKPILHYTIMWPSSASRKPKKREKFTDNEISKLIEYAKTSSNHCDKLIALAAMTGLRIGELCGLRFGDFDYKEKSVKVERTVGRLYIDGKSELFVNTPKTPSSLRTVPVPSWLISYFKSYQSLFKLSDENYLTCLISQIPFIEPRTFRPIYYALCDKAGIRRLPPHSLRHTYASRLLMARTDIRTTAELLGHGDVNTTLNIYAHSDEDKKRLAAKKIFL